MNSRHAVLSPPDRLQVLHLLAEYESVDQHIFLVSDLANRPCERLVPLTVTGRTTERLKQWNLVTADVRITAFRRRNSDITPLFQMKNDLCYCSNAEHLFAYFGMPHNSSEWRLFIDSNKRSFKAVLLHNGNVYPSVPIGHFVHLKESYEYMETLLNAIK